MTASIEGQNDGKNTADGWEDPLSGASSEERIKRLERMAAKYREIAQQEEGLLTSVDNLGITASALADALRTVDHNQQALSKLGIELREVDQKTASIEQSTKGALDLARNERKAVLAKIYGTLIISGAGALAIIIGVTNYAQGRIAEDRRYKDLIANICETRNKQADVIASLVVDSEKRINTNPDLTALEKAQAVERGRAFATAYPRVDCTTLRAEAKN